MGRAKKVVTPRLIIMLFIALILIPFSPLLITGRWNWAEAWAYAISYIFAFAVSRALAARRHPDILAERARFLDQPDAKPWDKVLSPALGLGSGLLPIVAGLDNIGGPGLRVALGVRLAALVVIVAGYCLASWGFVVNRFFSGVVRIQADRGHHVVSEGPYRWLRHPGYAGSLITCPAIPLFLTSAWAFVPAALLIAVIFIRTRLEDRSLQEELPGYREYAGRVHYRLIPGVW